MGRNKSHAPYLGVLEDGLNTLQRIQQWGAAAELLYTPNSLVSSPQSSNEPHALTVARQIATIMARLNELCRREAEVLLTPRLALLELADVIRHGLVSFHQEGFNGQLGNAEVLAKYVAHRTAPQCGVIEGLHVITWVSVKLRIELFIEQLRKRVDGELAAAEGGGSRTEQQLSALRTTQLLFNDFESLYDNLLVTFPCVQYADTIPEVGAQLMPILLKQYYQIAEWVELVESNNALPPLTETRVQSVDAESSSFVVRRQNPEAPLGLVFNECGRIVEIDPSVRSASASGEELHRLLRCSEKGAVVVAVNGKPIPRSPPSKPSKVLEMVHDAVKKNKRVVVKVAKELFKQPKVHQLAFIMPNQGGEGSSGQRATLVLHRSDRLTPWGCQFDQDLIINKIPRRELSEDAKNFFTEYSDRVSITAVNGVEVTTVAQAQALCSDTETAVLSLVVVTPAMAQQRKNRTTRQDTSVTLTPQQIEQLQETPLVPEQKTLPPLNQAPAELLESDSVVDGNLDAALLSTSMEDTGEVEDVTHEPHSQVEEVDMNTYQRVAIDVHHGEDLEQEERQKQQHLESERHLEPSGLEGSTDADAPGPLVFPNDVAIDLLTPSEMVIRRPSTEDRWGLVLNKIGTSSGDALRVLQLPELPPKGDTRRKHPFYKTFKNPSVPTEWRIESVNNTPVSKAADILEIMRKSLKLSIKFFKL
ncbi:hypothetical protein, conserved [Trypanosoma brucei gambiense DAL972]|uniref:PDZ domain-containing protein n=2 Tax=Trypanosoma brucei TaxID=5691 RepID=Q389C5_TRYB2|nr:hypothetical protein, conserved [Trypanosoma brucei gambiense DAL972]XP_823423.1 hypothetical protein, conserved [Trypanosoma brucei brucei TREU927]EAN78595.1 hypothetical protein, conserved [Trypanosoma brucei brucei TREU927]CBH16371.1 hypothetical protein, conserved [Trypanosoma brucei gambiense DAL972]|eukprot:XP_011778635.1 hypothetical protein, conserved [Trypanosoma brucei gambiense DAL972]